jgi:hypothetical protein
MPCQWQRNDRHDRHSHHDHHFRPLTCWFGAPGRTRTCNLRTRSRPTTVRAVLLGAVVAAQVGWIVQLMRSCHVAWCGTVLISGPGLVDEVEGGLGDAAEAAEPGIGRHLAQALLAGLGAQGHPGLLRQHMRHAQQGGGSIEGPPDRG